MRKIQILLVVVSVILLSGCSGHDGYKERLSKEVGVVNVLFLHHSTGNNIYKGGVKAWFDSYDKDNKPEINFVETYFPKKKRYRYFGYGWDNYPYDYYNLWVKHGDAASYKNEPTLKTLAPLWNVIIFKHCFPASAILEDGKPDIGSAVKTLANYKLQYGALKKKLHEYPGTKFILWTGAALTEKSTKPDRAKRAKEFFDWVKNVWDEPGDNIYLWDFYGLETDGGLYMRDEYATSPTNSHPNKEFSKKVAPLFCRKVVDVIKHDGMNTNLQGEEIVE